MAALHLLPRELVHLLANKPLPVFPFSNCSHPARYSRSNLESFFFNRQFLRFTSDYRRVSLDSETARDFDRPSKGYDYPSISNSNSPEWLDVASFTEEITPEYSRSDHIRKSTHAQHTHDANDRFAKPPDLLSLTSDSSSTSTSSQRAGLVQNKLRGRGKLDADPQHQILSGIRQVTYGNAANCLRRGDLDSAIGWYLDAPASTSNSVFKKFNIAEKLLTLRLRDALIDQRPNDTHLIMRFVEAAAHRGHLADLGGMISHLARFTSYQYFKPFWLSTVPAVKQICTGRGRRKLSATSDVSEAIRSTNNKIIRSLCLSSRFTEAVDFLSSIRSQLSPKLNTATHDVSIPIERFTYKLLLEEMSRACLPAETIQEVRDFQDADYPVGQLETEQEVIDLDVFTTPLEEQETLARKIHENAMYGDRQAIGHTRRRLQKQSVRRASWLRRRSFALAPLKERYLQMTARAYQGELISAIELRTFQQACTQQSCVYLYKTLRRKMSMSNSERERRALLTEMQQGKLPSAVRLDRFIETSLRAQQPEVAAQLGRWMMMQSARYRGLWVTARIRRLVLTKNTQYAVDALRLYAQSYLLSGLPLNLVHHLQNTLSKSSPKEDGHLDSLSLLLPAGGNQGEPWRQPPKMVPSSHTVALAINAWLILDSTPSNIMATYQSLLSVYFGSSGQHELPLPMMVDQVSFGPFLNRLCKQGHTDEALQIMHIMKDRHIMPNAHNWDTLLGGFAKEGNEEMVARLFAKMEDARRKQSEMVRTQSDAEELAPPVEQTSTPSSAASKQSVNTLIASGGTPTHLSASLSQRKLDGFTFYPPNLVTYVTVIRGFCLANKVYTAQKYLKKMLVARTPSGERLYRYGENAQAEATFQIVRSMEIIRELGKNTSKRRELRSPATTSSRSGLSTSNAERGSDHAGRIGNTQAVGSPLLSTSPMSGGVNHSTVSPE